MRSSTKESAAGDTPAVDWSTLFVESGLDQSKFQPVTPVWTSPHESTARAAWDGSYPEQPELKIHVEAAAFEGKPVYFEILDAWDRPQDQQVYFARFRERALVVLLLSVFITVMVGSAVSGLEKSTDGSW